MNDEEFQDVMKVIQALWQSFHRSADVDSAWYCVLRDYDTGLVLRAVQQLTRANVYGAPTINQLLDEIRDVQADAARRRLANEHATKQLVLECSSVASKETASRVFKAIQWIMDAGRIKDKIERANEIKKRRAKVYYVLGWDMKEQLRFSDDRAGQKFPECNGPTAKSYKYKTTVNGKNVEMIARRATPERRAQMLGDYKK